MQYKEKKKLIWLVAILFGAASQLFAQDASLLVLGDLHLDKFEWHDMDYVHTRPQDFAQISKEYPFYTATYMPHLFKLIQKQTKETKPEKIEFMKQFASDVGMNPIVMDYHVHDKSVAAIRHVPHLLSTALVHVVSDNDDEEKHMQLLAAGCFRDMSRVAASSPEMWEQICLTNSSAISNILEQYIEMLETIKDNIDKKTPGYVASLFEMSREYRNSLESRHPEH